MKCDICRQKTDNLKNVDGKNLCLKCYMDYLKWQIKRGELTKDIDTYKRKYGTSG